MYKKLASLLLSLILIFAFAACTNQPNGNSTQSSTQSTAPSSLEASPKETEPVNYSYKIEEVQNVHYWKYIEPSFYFEQTKVRAGEEGGISLWPQCPSCGEYDALSVQIDLMNVDFSTGDKVMYSDSYSCWDCWREKDIDQYMWTIYITRIPE